MYPLFTGTLFSLLFILAIQSAVPSTGVVDHVMRRDGCAAMITGRDLHRSKKRCEPSRDSGSKYSTSLFSLLFPVKKRLAHSGRTHLPERKPSA
ncbi:hypothetical protein M430DRAFT_218414 [Amorphotheca resinae ATCC 22711]|uniref:Secreted protein n=1 Tax=Amorphotheca resinae ATCC 22711 TaxID=857342 RepID=A0A2T3B561_AMORE|nr:hypothetical protein M430DRAFT_218414 [Amorphotheca resinae ATCC 22711]PSS21895.1 hypothetical protein M430DRAFT_218414 [Amorphotheca resinae ATCC 22711]